MNKPTRKSTFEPTNDLSIDLWECQMEINKINSMKKSQPCEQCQDKISERVTFSKQKKDAEVPYHLLPKHTQQAMIIYTFSLDGHVSPQFYVIFDDDFTTTLYLRSSQVPTFWADLVCASTKLHVYTKRQVDTWQSLPELTLEIGDFMSQ